jgi:hypothetical protein
LILEKWVQLAQASKNNRILSTDLWGVELNKTRNFFPGA